VIENQDVYAGAEIINETVNEIIITNDAMFIILLFIISCIYMFSSFRLKKLKQKLKVLEERVNDRSV
jgi:hypothetical protein